MKKRIRYANEPMGKLESVEDFLPSPDELNFEDVNIKVTLALSQRSLEFFKREAGKHNMPYQRMIRRLLDAYAGHFDKAGSTQVSKSSSRSAYLANGPFSAADFMAASEDSVPKK